jgi:hypothetical protein
MFDLLQLFPNNLTLCIEFTFAFVVAKVQQGWYSLSFPKRFQVNQPTEINNQD